MKPDVVIAPCTDYSDETTRAALEQVLAPLGGPDWVSTGMKVVIKVNLVTAAKPEEAATTHPGLLCSLVRMLAERGADVVVGDSPGGLYTAAYVGRIYAATGMKAVEQAGGRLNQNFEEREAKFPEGKVCRQFRYTAYLDDADAVIDFCKLKTHGMMAMTCGAKNMFGAIPGTVKPESHFRYPDPRDFARMIVDLDEYFKPRLTIVDAVDCMEGNGPTGGVPRHMGAVLAGESPHKIDLVCAGLIGLRREEVPTLEAALERGLIPASAEELTHMWEQYLQEVEEREKFRELHAELDYQRKELLRILQRYQLKDPGMWMRQAQAISNRNEMVEIRHDLILRRQKLRRQMEYNEQLAAMAQGEIKALAEEFPAYTPEIMELVSQYEEKG